MLLARYKNYFLLHLTVFIFGFTGILGKLITIPAQNLVWYRLLIAIVALFIFIRVIKKQNLKCTQKQLLFYTYDYKQIAEHRWPINKEIIQNRFHPKNMKYFSGWGIEEFYDYEE